MRSRKTSPVFAGLGVLLLALAMFGLAAEALEASVCEEAAVYCLFDPGPIYAWDIARVAFCANGYYFCRRYVG